SRTKILSVIGIAAVMTLAACASTPPPTEQIAVSRAAVSSANSNGANEFAPIQLKSAMEKLAAAEQAMSDRKFNLARQLAEQAQVDAQLASSVADSAKAQKAAAAIQEDSRVLRKEIDRLNK
ncbi:MAG: DUF4398 domain-containing protein, partial [Sideroxydans sp.]